MFDPTIKRYMATIKCLILANYGYKEGREERLKETLDEIARSAADSEPACGHNYTTSARFRSGSGSSAGSGKHHDDRVRHSRDNGDDTEDGMSTLRLHLDALLPVWYHAWYRNDSPHDHIGWSPFVGVIW